MSEEDSNNLKEIKYLLQEINGKMHSYMQAKLMLEGEFGQKKQARQEYVKTAQNEIWNIQEIYSRIPGRNS